MFIKEMFTKGEVMKEILSVKYFIREIFMKISLAKECYNKDSFI